MILESLKREDTQVGAWVNVMGYVDEMLKERKREQCQEHGATGLAKRGEDELWQRPRAVRVRVQAVMLWSAGGVKIGEYERTLGEKLKLENGAGEGGARGVS